MKYFFTKRSILGFFLVLGVIPLYSKRMIVRQQRSGNEKFKDKNWLNQNSWFKIAPLRKILEKNSQIFYNKLTDKIFFDYTKFLTKSNFPNQGYFHELFILNIPNGRVQGIEGYVFIDHMLPDEMARGDRFECLADIPKIEEQFIKKVSGRVAVIAQHGAGGKRANYYHAMCEVLGRLAMLEIYGIEYDWLYVPMDKKFMREALLIWGIDFSKIISPESEEFCIEADEIILPSMVINTNIGHAHSGNFQHPIVIQYVREKLLKNVEAKNIDTAQFSKRIFILRKDSDRRILNEDKILNLLKDKGFKGYELSKMSLAEQIVLFNNSEIIVSEHGAGLTNCLFCNKSAKLIEIFQKLLAIDYWWLSSVIGIEYVPVLSTSIDVDYFVNWREKNFMPYYISALSKIELSDTEIQKIIAIVEKRI